MTVNKHVSNTHKHSLKKELIVLLTSVLVLLIGLLVYSNINAAVESNRKIAASNERTLDYAVSQIENGLSNVDEMMIGLVAYDTGYRTLFGGASALQAHLASTDLIQQLKEYLRIYTYCDAFFVYSAQSDSYRDIFDDDFDYAHKRMIEEWMRMAVQQDAVGYGDGWVTREIAGEKYLMRFYGGRGTYMIALSSFSSLGNIGLYSDQETAVTFCTADGSEITGEYEDIDFSKVLIEEDFLLTGSPRRMVLHKNISKTDGTLLLLIGNSEFFSGLSDMQLFLVCLSFLSIMLIPTALMWVRRSVTRPLDMLEKTISEIRSGNLEAETPSSEILEFQEVSTTFNEMMKQIRTLRIEAYENEIETQRAQLQYLQLQIRPHFYLNCLKGLYAVAQQRDVEKIQKMILSISGHLRYMFRDQLELVPIEQEIGHIRTYIEIQQLFSACPPECRIDVPEELNGFMIPPLSLSTFVENSIKHRGEGKTCVLVKAMELVNDTERFIDLTVQDNGAGFSEQVLRELTADDSTVYATEHVGIRNIKKRFRLIYGERVMFAFYNTPQGPVSEIVIPLGKKEDRR